MTHNSLVYETDFPSRNWCQRYASTCWLSIVQFTLIQRHFHWIGIVRARGREITINKVIRRSKLNTMAIDQFLTPCESLPHTPDTRALFQPSAFRSDAVMLSSTSSTAINSFIAFQNINPRIYRRLTSVPTPVHRKKS